MEKKNPLNVAKERKYLVSKISKIELENEGWSLIGTHRENRLEADLIKVETKGSTTVRIYYEYDVSIEVSQYKKGEKTKRLEEIKEKIFRREYKDESSLYQPLPKVYE